MNHQESGNRKRDLAGGILRPLLIFGLPTLAVLGTAFGGFSDRVKVVVWPLAFLWMGVACLTNARRCGRVHCWFTGPWFLLAAAVTVLRYLEVVEIAWPTIINAGLAGALLLFLVSENIWGKYFGK